MRFPKLFKKILKKGLHFASGCGMIIKPSREAAKTVGVDYDEGPPVPIPNTEVKLVRAENTWLVTAREDRCSPTQKREQLFRKEQLLFLFPPLFSVYVKKACSEKLVLENPIFRHHFPGFSLT